MIDYEQIENSVANTLNIEKPILHVIGHVHDVELIHISCYNIESKQRVMFTNLDAIVQREKYLVVRTESEQVALIDVSHNKYSSQTWSQDTCSELILEACKSSVQPIIVHEPYYIVPPRGRKTQIPHRELDIDEIKLILTSSDKIIGVDTLSGDFAIYQRNGSELPVIEESVKVGIVARELLDEWEDQRVIYYDGAGRWNSTEAFFETWKVDFGTQKASAIKKATELGLSV